MAISIPTPLAGSDYVLMAYNRTMAKFQSTLPLRGATPFLASHVIDGEISIHTPLAGSDCREDAAMHDATISIHTPLAGSDAR